MGQGHLKDMETSELWTPDHMIHQSDFPRAHSLHQSHKFAFSYNWLVPFHKTQLKTNLFAIVALCVAGRFPRATSEKI